MSRYQRGHIYEAFGAFHIRFYQTELRDGQLSRVQKSHRLCAKDRKRYSAKSKPVQLLCDDFMRNVNTETVTKQDMTVAQLWERALRAVCEEIVRLTANHARRLRRFVAISRLEATSRSAFRQADAARVRAVPRYCLRLQRAVRKSPLR